MIIVNNFLPPDIVSNPELGVIRIDKSVYDRRNVVNQFQTSTLVENHLYKLPGCRVVRNSDENSAIYCVSLLDSDLEWLILRVNDPALPLYGLTFFSPLETHHILSAEQKATITKAYRKLQKIWKDLEELTKALIAELEPAPKPAASSDKNSVGRLEYTKITGERLEITETGGTALYRGQHETETDVKQFTKAVFEPGKPPVYEGVVIKPKAPVGGEAFEGDRYLRFERYSRAVKAVFNANRINFKPELQGATLEKITFFDGDKEIGYVEVSSESVNIFCTVIGPKRMVARNDMSVKENHLRYQFGQIKLMIENAIKKIQPDDTGPGQAAAAPAGRGKTLTKLQQGIIDAYNILPNTVDKITDDSLSTWLANRGITNDKGEPYTREHINRTKNNLIDKKILKM